MNTIDLTFASRTSSPVPSTSSDQNNTTSSLSLYTQLQGLEEQDGVIRNEDFIYCTICDHFIDIYDGMVIRNCLHQICLDCIKQTIINCDRINVTCPIANCEYLLEDREIRSLLTPQQYEFHMNKCVAEENHDNLYKELLDLEYESILRNVERFQCQICFTDAEVGEGILIRECLHQYCVDCIRNVINHSEEARIKCPTLECECFIHDREIHALLSPTEYDKYSMKVLRIAESQAPNSYHCKMANCEGWCFVEDEVNTFICPMCSSQNCLACQAIHTGKNCKEYQDDLRYAGLTDDQRSQLCLDEMVQQNLGMRCTTCKIVIMKREGCDFLKCSMCKTELCWATKGARWGPGGRGDTSGGCRCMPTKRCHPKCGNCH